MEQCLPAAYMLALGSDEHVEQRITVTAKSFVSVVVVSERVEGCE